MKIKLLGLCLLGVLFMNCSPNNDDLGTCAEEFVGAVTANEMFIVGDWVLTATESNIEVDLTYDDVDNPSTDVFIQGEDCQKDAVYSFGADRFYSFKNGYTEADCTQKFQNSGTFQLADAILSITNECAVFNIPIEVDSSETEFKVSNAVNIQTEDGQSVSAIFTYTYTKY